jgi:hypothetical protein
MHQTLASLAAKATHPLTKSMPSFLPGFAAFAIAGLVAAAAPVIIHLLNRRRFRVVDWAAMEFLLEAVRRNRRILHLRDLLLLAVRTVCIVLFGLALARPFFASSSADYDPDRAIHAVMVVDNSLSMGYEKLNGSLLDEARARASDFIGELPEGSRISVVPLCGNPAGYTLDAHRTKEDARDALAKIQSVDRSGDAVHAADLAIEAVAQAPDLSKRVIFIGDQQRVNWKGDAVAPQWEQLGDIQVVDISPESPENTWVEDFKIQDAISDTESPTVFTATIRHEGKKPRPGVQVTLSVDGADVASKTVDLEPGQSLPVSFEHRFEVQTDPGKPTFVSASVTLSPDRLPEDDVRHLVAPVVAALPVVFVDQFGADEEDVDKNLYGETHHLRRLLAPVLSRFDPARQLVEIRHTTVDGLDQKMLEDARLVVIAGVADPGPAVELLREYIVQGGQVLIAAGGDFDPALWTESAWLEGAGILPAPLESEPVGAVPDRETKELTVLQLAPDSMMHEYFILPDVPREELADLYREPYFFKAVRADLADETMAAFRASEQKRLADQLAFLSKSDAQRAVWAEAEARGTLDAAAQDARELDAEQRAQVDPTWLLWDNQRAGDPTRERPQEAGAIEELAEKLAEQETPRALATFDNGVPYLIERNIGRGRVVMATSGVFSNWNTLPKTNAVLMFDRVLRSLLESTLPPRNFSTVGSITLPVRASERRAKFVLTRPDESEELLFVEAIRGDTYGVTIRDASDRGIYSVTAYRTASTEDEDGGVEAKLWKVPIAVNGPGGESDLTPIDQSGLSERMGDAGYRWVGRNDTISLEGAQVYGQDLWWWLILLVMLGLLLEMSIIAWPSVAREETA